MSSPSSSFVNTAAAAAAARERRQVLAASRGAKFNTLATILRRLLTIVVALYYLHKVFGDQLYPWGQPVPWMDRQGFSSLKDFLSNDLLRHKVQKIHQRRKHDKEPWLIKGTETIVVDAKGNMFGMTEEAELVLVTGIKVDENGNTTAQLTVVKDLGVGRPLGGEITKNGNGETLWIADAALGLTRIKNPTDPHSKVELVARTVTLDDGTVSPLLYVNDLAIGPQTGKVYFTDSSTVPPTRVGTRTWDTLYAAKADFSRGAPTGRLLVYDPTTDQVKVLATGFRFANGVGVDGGENYIIMGETFGMRVWKYHIKGPQAGEMEVLVSNLPGYIDGLSCAADSGQCFAVMQTLILPIHKLLASVPDFVDVWIRCLILALPRNLAPKVKPFGGLLQVDGATGETQYYLDPDGSQVAHLAGSTYYNGKVYLGSLKNDYIGVFTP